MTGKANTVDLSTFDEAIKKQEDGIPVPIVGMDGKTDLGFSIRVAGPDSERAMLAKEELGDKMISEERFGAVSAKEAVANGIQYLAKITIGWEPAIKLDGKEMEYSVENAVKVYTRFNFIREQVDLAAGKRSRFIKG